MIKLCEWCPASATGQVGCRDCHKRPTMLHCAVHAHVSRLWLQEHVHAHSAPKGETHTFVNALRAFMGLSTNTAHWAEDLR